MPTEADVDLVILVTPTSRRKSRGKLADVELHFMDRSPLAGMKLIGFSIWEREAGASRIVRFPARTYTVNGQRRSYVLFRPMADMAVHDAIRDRILVAYAQAEARLGAERDGRSGT